MIKFIGMLFLAICVATIGKILLREYISHEVGKGVVARVSESSEIVSVGGYAKDYGKKFAESCKNTNESCAAFIDEVKRDCNENEAAACHFIGEYYWFRANNNKRALLYYLKACDLKHALACERIGKLYWVKWDYHKALEYYQKACDLDSSGGCMELGDLYRGIDNVEINYDRLVEYYGKACDLHSSTACYVLGYWYEHGDYERHMDLDMAIKYYQKACDLEDQSLGCSSYKRLHP